MDVTPKKVGNWIIDVLGIIALVLLVFYALAWFFGGCVGSTCFQSHKLSLNGSWNNSRVRQLEDQVIGPGTRQSADTDGQPIYQEPPPRFREPIRRPYGGMAHGGGYGPAPGPRYGMDQGDGQYRFRIDGEHHRCRPCFNAGEWQDNTCRCHGTAMLVPQ